MNSIRKHLTLLLLLGAGGLSLVGGGLSYRAARAAVLAEFDYSLRTKVHDFSLMAEHEHGEIDLEFAEKSMPEFERTEHPEYFQVTFRTGETIARSPSLASAELILPEPVPSETPEIYRLKLPGGLPGRAAALAVNVEGKWIDMVVARDTVRLDRLFFSLALGFSGATLLLLTLLAIGLLRLVGRGLRPLDTFARQVAEVKPGESAGTFNTPTLPLELRPIAGQLDELLERMAKALERERYLTAAMAHELNTPIAELRIAAELALKWPDDSTDADTAEAALAIALQMQRVVKALLSLSRCEADLQKMVLSPTDIGEVLEESFQSVAVRLHEKEITISKDWKTGFPVETDRAMLAVVLDNLFRNATEYTPTGGVLEFHTACTEGNGLIALTNTQEMLDESDLESIFDPLWRKDTARTGTAHCGLGLAIAKRFCNQLGIQLTATLPAPDQFRITLSFPFQ